MLALHDQCPEDDTDDLVNTSFLEQYVRSVVAAHATAQGAAESLQQLLAKDPSDYRLRQEVLGNLLHQDAIAVYMALASQDDTIGSWLNKNATHAVANCPNVLNAWIEEGFSHLYMAAHKMTQALALAHSDEDKKAFLQGDTTTSAGKIVARLLRGTESGLTGGWPHFSPSWIGAEGSALRQTAIDRGWTPKDAMPMVDLFILEDRPESWIGNLSYPYTAMVCRWIVGTLRFGRLRAVGKHGEEGVMALPTADPVDMALAELVYQLSPVGLRAQLVNHPSVRKVSEDERAALRVAVQTEFACGGIHAVIQLVCTGDILAARQCEVYAVDNLV